MSGIKTGVLFITMLIAAMNILSAQINIDEETELLVNERIKAYVPTHISADLTKLTQRQVQLVKLLSEAGKVADEIFWIQTAHDAISTKGLVYQLSKPSHMAIVDYVMINYGPYDAIHDDERFVGNGPSKRPAGGNFYPIDMTKEEFENYVKNNPAQKEELENQYTVVIREGKKLRGIPYHLAYPKTAELSAKLSEAATYCDDPALKKYLELRAKAISTDDYYESDMAWMDVRNGDIDVVIGPIENYEDAMFNYKTAYEAVVMVKDFEASKELDMYNENIPLFQEKLPCKKEYIGEVAGTGTFLQVVNVAYFGGDCQRGIKTIAAALPNDPKVYETKGSKKSMYKNMMEAKFDNIVKPIASVLIDEEDFKYVDKKAFTSFVTLHEVSHTLGRGYVYGNKELTVRKALKERYSAIEECKADILGMYNHKHLFEKKLIDKDYLKKAMVTYLAGLYRSVRFGIESAHGQANMIQMNFLREKGAIYKTKSGKMKINEDIFFDKVGELAGIILNIQAEGDYNAAGKLMDKYRVMTDEIKQEISLLKKIPTDLNTTYDF